MIVQPERWQLRAACLGMDPNLFHPGQGEDASRAKHVCRACPVTEECWLLSVEIATKHGIWGGMSEWERKARRRREGIVLGPRWPRDVERAVRTP